MTPSERFAKRNQILEEYIAAGRHQEAWDYLLCWCWAYDRDWRMYLMVDEFQEYGGRTQGLRRIPGYRNQSIRVFVGNHLKLLSNRLWDFYERLDMEAVQSIAAALSRSKMDCESGSSWTEECRMRQRERAERRANTASVALSNDYWSRVNALRVRGADKAGYR